MRCLVRNVGAMLAMVWSGAAAAHAGLVNVRTSSDLFKPAGAAQVDDWQPTTDVAALGDLASQLAALPEACFPDGAMPASALVPVHATAAPATRPAAIMIPLPPALRSGIAGLGCAAVAAWRWNASCRRRWNGRPAR